MLICDTILRTTDRKKRKERKKTKNYANNTFLYLAKGKDY